jgi:hypothetical protein
MGLLIIGFVGLHDSGNVGKTETTHGVDFALITYTMPIVGPTIDPHQTFTFTFSVHTHFNLFFGKLDQLFFDLARWWRLGIYSFLHNKYQPSMEGSGSLLKRRLKGQSLTNGRTKFLLPPLRIGGSFGISTRLIRRRQPSLGQSFTS